MKYTRMSEESIRVFTYAEETMILVSTLLPSGRVYDQMSLDREQAIVLRDFLTAALDGE